MEHPGKLRGAILGCGMISEFHLMAWRRLPAVEIVALAGRTAARCDDRRAAFVPNARVYDGLTAMLASERLDFVDILTPPELHLQHSLEAAEAGLHVICQKPLADRLDTSLSLVSAVSRRDRLFAVHENHRYRPWFCTLVEKIRANVFGTIRSVTISQHDSCEPAEAYKQQSSSGILLEYGTHLIDMARAMLGEPIATTAWLHRINPRVAGESLAKVVFQYAQGSAEINVAWKTHGPASGGLHLIGDRGEFHYNGTMTRGDDATVAHWQEGKCIHLERRSPTDDYVESFYRFQRECVDAMLTGGPVQQTATENLKTLMATFASYESARVGRTISLEAFTAEAMR